MRLRTKRRHDCVTLGSRSRGRSRSRSPWLLFAPSAAPPRGSQARRRAGGAQTPRPNPWSSRGRGLRGWLRRGRRQPRLPTSKHTPNPDTKRLPNPPTPLGSPSVEYFCCVIAAFERLRPPLRPLQGGLADSSRGGGVKHQGVSHKSNAAPSFAQQATLANPNRGLAPRRLFKGSLEASYKARSMLSQTHLPQGPSSDLLLPA